MINEVAGKGWGLAACERGLRNVCCVCLEVSSVIRVYLNEEARISADCALTGEVSQ